MPRFYYHGWIEEEDRALTQIMQSGRKRRMKLEELFHEAADKLGRSVSACRNRWYEIRPKHNEAV